MIEDDAAFNPDYALLPGTSLLEALARLGISQAELADRTRRPRKTINEIIKGKAAITAETAVQLERVLDISARFWMKLEQDYRVTRARLLEREELAGQTDFLTRFPFEEMVRRGWVAKGRDKVQSLQNLLKFFAIATPGAWDDVWQSLGEAVAFRKSGAYQTDIGALSAWIRRGELEAREIECAPFDAARFRASLLELRRLTPKEPDVFHSAATEICAKAGVAVVFLREFPKMRTFGATKWVAPDKAVLLLSLFYKKEDHLWFTFFHEAGHILLHGKRDLFVDSKETLTKREEEEANRFAADLLISPSAYKLFIGQGDFSAGAIKSFAASEGISPGIVVGRLQHEGVLQHSERNELKRTFKWVAD